MNIDLKGKVALVTGASRGIGKAIAVSLAQAGARVAVHCNRNTVLADQIVIELGEHADIFQADLSEARACNILLQDVISRYGRIDILVNNAGIAQFVDDSESMSSWLEAWEKTMAVNARATALLCRFAIEQYQTQGGGCIINIASRAAFRGDTAEYMIYAASKGAVVSLTRSIARAYGRDGIKAFVVAPGFVRTDMAQDSIDAYGEEFVVNDLALSRLTEPEDIAPMVTLLASGLADHATGTSIDINAGSYVH
ncbi:MAG: SDR family NAD(P)-dependent oxidoreductase [Bacteroidetes bacterium]|nr:SDR family NAD(P)-dependent oxidoreductase [Bacteroidota bacterium]MCY4204231.1 SDR family NAD(P)-dependent oxidoreductase [Bacteroidota bacterium]